VYEPAQQRCRFSESSLGAQRLLGSSAPIVALRERLEAVARARRTTLITGPTGSGKEVVALALHAASGVSAPYVPVHCGALPEQLAEAELFGHTRGAFTGATNARPGLIKSAEGGTLFLDEIDSLSLASQAKLLRFLETGEYRAVGSDRIDHARVWVLAASNSNLGERVQKGQFRDDLLYRLDLIHLELPSLRMRGADVEILARHFLKACGRSDLDFSDGALRAIYAYDWPGNVRELRHSIERAAVLATGDTIDVESLQLSTRPTTGQPPSNALGEDLWALVRQRGLTLVEAVAHCERLLIEAALHAEDENRTRAAQRLGIHVRTMFKKLQR
jgi:DNA-binding NtrC family response regulator